MNGLSDGQPWLFSEETFWLASYFLLGLECNINIVDTLFVHLMVHSKTKDFSRITWHLFKRVREELRKGLSRVGYLRYDNYEEWETSRWRLSLTLELDDRTNAPKRLGLICFRRPQGNERKQLNVFSLGDKLAYSTTGYLDHLAIWPNINRVADVVIADCIKLFLT